MRGDLEGRCGAFISGRPRSLLEHADLDLGVPQADAITRLQENPWHLGPANQDPVGRAEVHNLRDSRELGDQQLGVTP
jgi:hypothetical protein